MDERLVAVRQEIEAGSVSPHSLVFLFNAASDAEHAGDIATLEQTLGLARAIAEAAGESLQAEAERLATICAQSLTSVRERHEASAATEARGGMIICPECGNEVQADALRCRRCGHRFI
jgi:ribosomal protein L40E